MSEQERRPSVGRIVHFYRTGTPVEHGGPLAAIITGVYPNVSLQVFDPVRGAHEESAEYSAEPAPGRWTWPPFVGPKKAYEAPAIEAEGSAGALAAAVLAHLSSLPPEQLDALHKLLESSGGRTRPVDVTEVAPAEPAPPTDVTPEVAPVEPAPSTDSAPENG